MSQNTVQTDAKEFGLHVKQGGWRLGLLVARNVEKGEPGRPSKEIVAVATFSEKVSARQFATDSGTSKDTVLRALAAWNRAAAAGIVPASADLHPGQEVDLDVENLPEWRTFYVGTPEARPDRITNDDRHEATTRLADVTPTPVAIAAAIKANPETARAARDALDEVYEAAPKPYADEVRRRAPLDEALDLIEEFRRLHRGVDHIVQLVNDGRAQVANPDAVLREIAWLRTALGFIEDGVKSDDLAAQVEQFLAEVG